MITSDDILGREAVDPDGVMLGVIVKLHISKQEKQIVGITVDQGFMKPDLFIGIDHVKIFGIDAVFLSTIPYDRYKGLPVMRANGSPVGTCMDVVVTNNELKQVVIRPRGQRMASRQLVIDRKHIDQIGESIVLKKNARTEMAK